MSHLKNHSHMRSRPAQWGCMAAVHLLVLLLGAATLHAEPSGRDDPSFLQRLSLGVRLGLNTSWIGGDSPSEDIADHFRKSGFSAGARAQLEINPWLSVEIGLSYLPKGERSVLATSGRRSEIHLDYLSTSLLAAMSPYRHQYFVPYMVLGPELGYLLDCQDISEGEASECSSSIQTWDIGIVAGIGTAVRLPWSGAVIFEARYEHGLRSVDGRDGADYKNRAVLFLIGYSHRLGGADTR